VIVPKYRRTIIYKALRAEIVEILKKWFKVNSWGEKTAKVIHLNIL